MRALRESEEIITTLFTVGKTKNCHKVTFFSFIILHSESFSSFSESDKSEHNSDFFSASESNELAKIIEKFNINKYV